MQDFNLWLIEKLGAWTIEYFGLWLVLAAVFALIIVIALISAMICHAVNKKKIAALKEQADGASHASHDVDEQTLREQIRAELAAEQDNGDRNAQQENRDAEVLSVRIDELNRTIEELEDGNKEKQNRINELTAMLERSGQNDSVNNDLYRQINELSQTTREQENEINLLKAENAQIKAQVLQQQLAAASNDQKQTPHIAKKSTVSETTAAADGEYDDDDDDEYDEYYDDYGDETSAIKVTLKFDRLKNNWIILRSDTDRTYRRLATKQEALVIAKDLARRLHAQLAVHKKDGKFQKI